LTLRHRKPIRQLLPHLQHPCNNTTPTSGMIGGRSNAPAFFAFNIEARAC
jgi:hypothetical protein